jgi:hypothetical protein
VDDTTPFEAPTAQGEPAPVATPRGPRRVPGRLLALVVVFGVALSGTLVFLASTAAGDTTDADNLVAAANADLDHATAELAAAEQKLTESKAALEAMTAERTRLVAEVDGLDGQAAAGGRCLTEQSSLIADLSRIADLDTDNFNRTTEGSAWAKAFETADRSVTLVLDRYYDAYSEAYFNRDAKARQYATQAATAVERLEAQRAIMATEQKTIDATALEVQAALDEAQARLVAAEQVCGEVGHAE